MLTNAPSFSGFSVNDLDAAASFYGTVLGIGVKRNPEGLALELFGRNPVFIYEKSDHVPATYTVLNFVVDDIDWIVDELTAKGIRFERYDEGMLKTDEKGIARGAPGEPGPAAIAWFRDPAGNFLSVIKE